MDTGGTATGGAATGGAATGGATTGGAATGGATGGTDTGGTATGGAATGGAATGGAATGGGATGGAATGGSSGDEPGTCSLTLTGATGNESGGLIPVCCTPETAEQPDIDEVFSLLNAHRASNGVSALAYDNLLQLAIQGHCVHMSAHSFFAHEAPESSVTLPWGRAELCGTTASGENIAQGYGSPSAVMTGWTNSSGHNANMLNGGFTRVGIGFEDAGSYWGQIFD